MKERFKESEVGLSNNLEGFAQQKVIVAEPLMQREERSEQISAPHYRIVIVPFPVAIQRDRKVLLISIGS